MSKNCIGVDLYEDINRCAGETNLPGTLPYFFMLKKRNIKTWPTLRKTTVPGITMAKLAVYSGSFDIGEDYQWIKVDMVPDSATFGSESQGNWGGKTFNNTATLVVPGTKKEVTGLVSMINNDSCVTIIPDRNGKFRVIGAEAFDVVASIKQEQGTAASGDSAQTTIELACTSPVSLPFYEGRIVTSDGVVVPEGLFYRYTLLYKVGNEVVRTKTGIVDPDTGTMVVPSETFKSSDAKRKFTSQRTYAVITRDEQEVTVPTTEIAKDYAYIRGLDSAGTDVVLFKSRELGFPDEPYNGYVHYKRAVFYNGEYYTVQESFGTGYNYAATVPQFGIGNAIRHTYAKDTTGIVYYAESEDMVLEGSFRGGELVPERASGGDWHRLAVASHISTDVIDTKEGPYMLTVAARNMGSSNGVLTVSMGSTQIGTLEWAASEHKAVSIEIPDALDIQGRIDIVNETGYTSGVCIDYVTIRRTH